MPSIVSLRDMPAEYDDLTLTLLRNRGIEAKDDIERFLNPSYDEHLSDPLLTKNMRAAATRLAAAILSGEKIVAWTDYDCDGVPAAVILHDFFKKAGANFENYIPHRHLEGYGVNIAGIEKLAAAGAKLVVTADVGITDVEAIARARDLGMGVIVTDHHLAGETLPDAIVVNPNAHVDETAPFKAYCGAGVAWRLVCATLAVEPMLRERVPVGWEKWLLDMVGLATIADMMPLVGENRVLATYGMRVLRKSPRVGLQKLCRVLRVNQAFINEDDIGFMLAPRVNAASRMGDAWDALRLFTTVDENEADVLAKKLDAANRDRKAAAGAITRAVHTRLAERGSSIPSVIALGDPTWKPSLLGLVANGIAEEYARPVFLWGREGNNSLKGSCRAGGTAHVLELMNATPETFVEFGGHRASGGFTVRDEAVFYLEERLGTAYDSLAAVEITPLIQADVDILPEAATGTLLRSLQKLSPFGEGNPKPLFRLRDCEVGNVSRFGKGEEHMKLRVVLGTGKDDYLEGISFFTKGTLAKKFESLKIGQRTDLLAHLERDQFSRRSQPRLRIIDILAA